ncbi:MAG: hypothetical protein N3D11_12545 [Candidatus Sumerlaeia bacterium]|nr:hypothetical protein [Candidatus Sumerlaeia bacterium]
MLFVLLTLVDGCVFRMTTPENFVRVKQSIWTPSAFHALTPQEDKLLVRHFTSGEKQTLKFWADTLRNNLVEERGYTLREEGEFKTDAGLAGHRFLFEITMSDVPYCYELVVFVTQTWRRQHIYAAEFLCQKKNFDANRPAVEKALKQFRPLRGR